MDDWRTAPVSGKLRAALEFLTKFVPFDAELDVGDIETMRQAGLSDPAIREVMYASVCFQNLSRWMDAFGAPLHTEKLKRFAAKVLWHMPYTRASVPPPF